MEHMDPERAETVRFLIDNIIKQAMLIPLEDAQQIYREVDWQESFSPFYDPTWFMQNTENIRIRKETFKTFLDFRAGLEKTKKSMGKEVES